MSQQLTQKITPGDLLGLGKCRVFPTKETTTVDPISNTVNKVDPKLDCRRQADFGDKAYLRNNEVQGMKYFEKYAACTLARSVESMCGPAAVYYTEPK